MTVSVTLQFADISSAAAALSRLSGSTFEPVATVFSLPLLPGHAEIRVSPQIDHLDRPNVGAEPSVALATAVFGGAVALAAPTLPVPPPPTQEVVAHTPPTAATSMTGAPGSVDRDSAGLPWDARIHASTKTKTGTGAWTTKRNIDAAFKAQIEADLRGGVPAGLPAPATGAVLPPVFLAPVAPAAPPAAPVVPAGEGFAQYMARIGLAFTNRPIDAHNLMAAALAPHGLQHVGQLAGRPDLISAVDAEFQRLLVA